MVNIKYYLTLLVSVFLSLGIGMVIGISLQSKDVLEKQHNTIAQRLEEEFIGMRNENRHLKEALDSLEASERSNRDLYESMFNAMVKNKLGGLRVSLIEAGDEKDFSSLIGLLKISGASIESSLTFSSRLFAESHGTDVAISALSQLDSEGPYLYDELASNLIDSLHLGEYTPFIKELGELNLIHSSIYIQDSCDAIILAHNGPVKDKGTMERFCHHLMQLSLDKNIPIIFVQDEGTGTLDLSWYRETGISTIDHVNTLSGKLTLVSLLYGNKGNYGYGEGSDGIMPDEIFPLKEEFDTPIGEELDQGPEDKFNEVIDAD